MAEQETFDSSDPKHVKDRQDNSKIRESKEQKGLKDAMSTPEGRAWVFSLLDMCGVHRTSFTGNSTTFFNEGQRNIGLKIEGDIFKWCPDKYITMMTEGRQK